MLRNWFNLSKAIGFILTIAGLVLAVWFLQVAALEGPAPLPSFIVGAIAAAMISVGISDCVKQVAEALAWRGKEELHVADDAGPIVRAKGLGVAIKSTSTPSTSAASIHLNGDGSAVLLTSSVDMGQGARTRPQRRPIRHILVRGAGGTKDRIVDQPIDRIRAA